MNENRIKSVIKEKRDNMGIEKKIFSLFFLLLLLIASCLYINVPKLMENEESIKSSESIESILKDTISKIIGNDKKHL